MLSAGTARVLHAWLAKGLISNASANPATLQPAGQLCRGEGVFFM
jgi:hypothetical protein